MLCWKGKIKDMVQFSNHTLKVTLRNTGLQVPVRTGWVSAFGFVHHKGQGGHSPALQSPVQAYLQTVFMETQNHRLVLVGRDI